MHIIMLRFYGELTSRIAMDTLGPESRLDSSGGGPVREVTHNQEIGEVSLKDSTANHAHEPSESD